VKPELLHILQHSLGADQYGRGKRYREYFVTGPGTTDFPLCRELVMQGLMRDHGAREIYSGMHLFTVTDLGVKAMLANSPQPPKLSRSAQRYRAFCIEDPSCSFGEWLKLQKGRLLDRRERGLA
jgi:hypothetical protein